MEAERGVAQDPFGLVGQTLAGRFRIERQIAEGGFGVVYRARQLVLDRPVALKVLKVPGDLTAAQKDAFHRTFEAEGRIIARLKHPHIVEVHDFGVTDGPPGTTWHWMALEWLEGRTLEAWLAERRARPGRPVAPSEALELLRPVIQSIAFAHDNGVAHRDLKPSNIFLVNEQGRVDPKVLDFGIAQMVSPAAAGDLAVSGEQTTRGFPAFSPDYAAPEQVSYGRTGPGTDVHALGLILTEMLTGQAPYPGTSLEERFEAAVSERRPTPATRGVMVGGWEPVLARALARRPADRYPDAHALLQGLENGIREAAPPPVPGPVTVPAIPRRSRTRRLVMAVAGLGVLAVVGATSYWRWRPPLPAPVAGPARVMMAVLPFENLTGDPQQEYLADGLTDGMIGELGRLSPERLAVIARTSIAQYKGGRKSVKQIGAELGVSYVLESSVKRGGNRLRIASHLIQVSDETQVWGEGYDREIKDVLALQNDIAQAIAAGVQVSLTRSRPLLPRARSVNPAAYDAYLRGRYYSKTKKDARAHFEQAIAIDPGYAAAHAALARSYLRSEIPPVEAGPRAKAAALRAVELDPELAEAHGALAETLLEAQWDWAGAEEHYRRALALDPNDGEALVSYARLEISVGRFDEAIAHRKRAAELSPAHPGPVLGTAYTNARRYDEAIAELQRVVALDPGDGQTPGFLGVAYVHKGMYREALAVDEKCRAAVAAADVPAAEQGRGLARCLARVTVWAQARAGHPDRALDAIEQMKVIARTSYVQPAFFARAYAGLGHRDETLAWLEKAYQEHSAELILLRVDPDWDLLQGDPRFAALIRRVGIPEP